MNSCLFLHSSYSSHPQRFCLISSLIATWHLFSHLSQLQVSDTICSHFPFSKVVLIYYNSKPIFMKQLWNNSQYHIFYSSGKIIMCITISNSNLLQKYKHTCNNCFFFHITVRLGSSCCSRTSSHTVPQSCTLCNSFYCLFLTKNITLLYIQDNTL